MISNEVLQRYRARRFSDEDIVRCTGLSVRAWRELIKHKAVNTVEETRGPGRGRVRLCDDVVFKRTAVIGALNTAGISLTVAGKIAFFLPYHTLLYAVCDPLTILFDHTAENDPATGLPPRRKAPATDWFQPNRPARAERQSDWLVEIYDGQFVGCRYGRAAHNTLTMFGDLRNAGTTFVAWHPCHNPSQMVGTRIARLAEQLLPYRNLTTFIADWEDPDKAVRGLQQIGYAYEYHAVGDPLRRGAEASARNFSFKTVVNVSFALKKAVRCYLDLEPRTPKEGHDAANSASPLG